MCGISGFIDYKKNTTFETLVAMTDALEHRGPDDKGYEIFENSFSTVGFGQRRLSILDLSPLGHQPMHYKHLVVDFNGEIYNFKEIRHELEELGYMFDSWSDTEVILKGFHKWGIQVVHKFIGMFAIAIYDRHEQVVYFIRDRAGVKPFYYYAEDDILLFTSELKSFHHHPLFKKDIDINSVALFLQYSYVPAQHCIFKNTQKLLPGHYLKIDLASKEKSIHKYWDVFDTYNKPLKSFNESEVIDTTDKLMQSAYEYRMMADVPVGIFLSGGYDSTSVAALLQHNRTEKLKTFTIGFHEANFNEAPEAKKIAEFLGTDHTEWYLTAKEAGDVLNHLPDIYDEPFADNSTVPTVLVSKLAREKVKVALSADGGDEIFGGYNKFNQSKAFNESVPGFVQGIISGAMSYINPNKIPYFNKQYNFSTRYEKMKLIWKDQDPIMAMKYISQYITESKARIILKDSFINYHTFFEDGSLLKTTDTYNKLFAIDYKTFLSDNNLVKVDRSTMSVGLEGREPMLDHRLIEYVSTLPSEFKIKNGVNKWLLKEIVHRYVPKEIMERPKRPFIAPLMIWFKDSLQEQLRYYLSEENLNKTGLFNAAPIVAFRDAYLRGENVNYQKLWHILIFQLWYDRWIAKL